MGSGLILLVIVGMWLAVLVPMALRNHDSSTSLRSADRFSDAMRVLSRRGEPTSDRDVLVPRRSYASLVVSETKSPRVEPTEEPVVLTAAERRRRALLVLGGLSLVSLGLALAGIGLAWVLHVACDLLLVAFVVHLRKQAVLRAAQRREQARRVRRAQPAPVRRAARIAGIPDRMPPRPAPLSAPLPAPAARYEDTVPAVAATGTDGTWSPVPVPPPTYVGKARAPRREPRVLDLTKPGEWTAALEDSGLDIFAEDDVELDDILTRRKAAGGW